MISSVSSGTAAATSVVASGSCKMTFVSRMKVVETMRNSTSTSSTSTSEITLISGSSLERFCSFIDHSEYTRPLLMVQQRLDEAHRLLFDPHDQCLDAPAQVAVRDQRRNRDRQARGRCDQRFRDAAGEYGRIRHTVGGDGRERANHARHGAEQPEQRRNRGDRAERAQVTLQLVNGMAPRVLDDLFQQVALRVPVSQARGQHLPERGALVNFLELLGVDLVSLNELQD